MDEKAIDELYGLPLDQFIPARTRLAKDLRAEGDREGAARVQSLRKPTVAAWAVNQLARRDRDLLDALFESGERLRAAQDGALRGKGGRELQDAGSSRRGAVDALVETAAKVLEETGHGGGKASLDAIANTLLAVATDPQAADSVRTGRVEKELPPPSGFGELGDLAVVLPMPDRRPARQVDKPHRTARPATVQSAADARAERRAKELAQQAEEAEREARRRREAADRAEADMRRMKEAVAEAERAAAKANRDAERAAKRAEEALDRAERARARKES